MISPLSRNMILGLLVCFIVSITETLTEQNSTNSSNSAESSNLHHGAVLGRVVQIPAIDYRSAFHIDVPELGDCALKKEEDRIQTCTEKFGGSVEFVPWAKTNVDVAKIRSTEDILNFGMGGDAVHEGVLGLTGAGLKNNLTATFPNSDKDLTLMTSYDFQKGLLSLRHTHPLTEVSPEGVLYLSEIELGGNEMLMVTMQFNSVENKREIEKTLTVNALFKAISDKLRYVKNTFDFPYSTRVQFRSSWRAYVDHTYTPTETEEAIAEVERLETLFTSGPGDILDMDVADRRAHHNYYFAAWNKSPYGDTPNMAAINNELETLNEQNLEVQATIYRIAGLSTSNLDSEKRAQIEQLDHSLRNKNGRLTEGIRDYHRLSDLEKVELRDIYGENKAPQYYARQLKTIIGY